MKKEVEEVLQNRTLTFLREKDTDVKKLRKDLYFILEEAFKKGDVPYRMVADVEIVGEKLNIEYRPAIRCYEEWDLNDDYKEVGPDKEEWPESVATCIPVPLEKINEIVTAAYENFDKKLENGRYLRVPENGTIEDARKQRREEIARYEAELIAELNAQLPFEMELNWKGIYPKKPYKEIDGCIVVKI